MARAIDGATAGNLSLAQAYISDVTEPKDRAKSFGIIGIAFGLGFLIGPAISGLLAKYDYRYPIFAAAAMSATSILTTYLLLPAVKPAGAGKASPDLAEGVSRWSNGAPTPSIFGSRLWRRGYAVFRFCVRLRDVRRGHAAGSRTPLNVAWQSFRSRTGRIYLGLRRIVGNMFAGSRAWQIGQALR